MPPAASEPAGRATSSRAERPLELTIAHTRAATATRPTTPPTITIRRFRFSRRSCSSRSLRLLAGGLAPLLLGQTLSVGMGSPSVVGRSLAQRTQRTFPRSPAARAAGRQSTSHVGVGRGCTRERGTSP
jgi:hypothetical protein